MDAEMDHSILSIVSILLGDIWKITVVNTADIVII